MLALSTAVPLRPYQHTCVVATLDSLSAHRAVLAVMATGLGKTRAAKAVVRSYLEAGKRVLWLVDTDDLVWQAKDALSEEPGAMLVDIDKAQRKAETWSDLVVASKQTLQNLKRLRRYASDAFDLIIADEAHGSLSHGWMSIFRHFPDAKILGLTATPDRADCRSLMTLYDDVPYEMEIRDGIQQGWLVPLIQQMITVEGLDYSQIRTQATRLRQGDMESALLNAEIIEQMAVPAMERCGNRQALVFTCSVDHAYAFAAYLKRLGVSAETVEGDQTRLPLKRRRQIIAAYKRGKIQVLTNCAALTTGFDAPSTSSIIFARPIISRSLYAQCCGRGTRPVIPSELNQIQDAAQRRQAIALSAKPNCLLLDFVGNAGRLRLVRAAATIDPDVDEETEKLAEKIAEERQIDMSSALEAAEEIRAELLREIDLRPIDGQHKYNVTEIDPFNGSRCQAIFGVLGLRRKPDRWGLPPTQAQIEALRRLQVPDPEVLDRRQAADLLTSLVERRQQGLASFRQVELLVEVGKLPRDKVCKLPTERARVGLEMLKANDWKRPAEWGPVAEVESE